MDYHRQHHARHGLWLYQRGMPVSALLSCHSCDGCYRHNIIVIPIKQGAWLACQVINDYMLSPLSISCIHVDLLALLMSSLCVSCVPPPMCRHRHWLSLPVLFAPGRHTLCRVLMQTNQVDNGPLLLHYPLFIPEQSLTRVSMLSGWHRGWAQRSCSPLITHLTNVAMTCLDWLPLPPIQTFKKTMS